MLQHYVLHNLAMENNKGGNHSLDVDMGCVNIHTVFVLIGPYHCNKTLFASRLASTIERQVGYYPNIVLHQLSGRRISEWIVENSCEVEEGNIVKEVSGKACDVLLSKLGAIMAYPHGSKFIILTVDSAESYINIHETIRDLATVNRYEILYCIFDYPLLSMYSGSIDPLEEDYYMAIVRQKCEVLQLRQKVFNRETGLLVPYEGQICPITSPSISSISFKLSNLQHHNMCQLDANVDWWIIGSLRGLSCEFKSVLHRVGWKVDNDTGLISMPPGKGLVIIGDLVGTDDDENGLLIDFLYKNIIEAGVMIRLVIGSYGDVDSWHGKSYAGERWCALIDRACPFLQMVGKRPGTSSFIATAALCSPYALGKLDQGSIIEQREGIDGDVALLPSNSLDCNQVHYNMGRNTTPRNIETRAGAGGRLTAVNHWSGEIRSVSAPGSFEYQPRRVFGDVSSSSGSISGYAAKKAAVRLRKADVGALQPLLFGGPTESPVETVESARSAINYYFQNGVSKLCVQLLPYGRRCQLVLERSLDGRWEVTIAETEKGCSLGKQLNSWGCVLLSQLQKQYGKFMERWKITKLRLDGHFCCPDLHIALSKKIVQLEYTLSTMLSSGLPDVDGVNIHKLKEKVDQLKPIHTKLVSTSGKFFTLSILEAICESGDNHWNPQVDAPMFGLENMIDVQYVTSSGYRGIRIDSKNQELVNIELCMSIIYGAIGLIVRPLELHTPAGVVPYLRVLSPQGETIVWDWRVALEPTARQIYKWRRSRCRRALETVAQQQSAAIGAIATGDSTEIVRLYEKLGVLYGDDRRAFSVV
jgi:hypothetical protein